MAALTCPPHDVELVPATHEAVDEVLELARSCARHMAGRGIMQWDDLYPDRGSIEHDARGGGALLARQHRELVAYLALDSVQDPEYAEVGWHLRESPVAVVHRLMVSPVWQGRGLGRWCMAVAEQRAAQAGYATMRLDAFTGNPSAMRLYEHCGYSPAGVVHFRTGEFTCFEKSLGTAR
jgi:GNAT superfamily N-acetyltransferase